MIARVRRLVAPGDEPPSSDVGDEDGPPPVRLEVRTPGGLTAGDFLDVDLSRVRPGRTTRVTDATAVAYDGAVVERLPQGLAGRHPVRVRIRLTATIGDPADVQSLADWLAARVRRDPEASTLVEGTPVDADPGTLAASLARAYETRR